MDIRKKGARDDVEEEATFSDRWVTDDHKAELKWNHREKSQ